MAATIHELNQTIHSLVQSEAYEDTIPYLEQAAAMEDVQAQITLASLYTFGYYVEKDEEKAFHYTLMAALNGDSDMMVNLAVFYKNGTGTPQDLEEAFFWFQKAAQAQHPNAWYGLALCYYMGQGCYQDFGLAREYAHKCAQVEGEYQQAAQELEKDLIFEYWLSRFHTYHDLAALEQFEQLARSGHTDSMVMLSCAYTREECARPAQAYYWARKAAEQEDPTGMYNLALYLWYGIGCEKNSHEGFIWMKNAAKEGYAEAYLPLAQMYLSKTAGIRPNLELALEWAGKAWTTHPDNAMAHDTYSMVIELYNSRR